jgi:hypothetical protein
MMFIVETTPENQWRNNVDVRLHPKTKKKIAIDLALGTVALVGCLVAVKIISDSDTETTEDNQ